MVDHVVERNIFSKQFRQHNTEFGISLIIFKRALNQRFNNLKFFENFDNLIIFHFEKRQHFKVLFFSKHKPIERLNCKTLSESKEKMFFSILCYFACFVTKGDCSYGDTSDLKGQLHDILRVLLEHGWKGFNKDYRASHGLNNFLRLF